MGIDPQRSFNRINSGRSIPTSNNAISIFATADVSIVSIQADQSRLTKIRENRWFKITFQSYQFRQINPDDGASIWDIIQRKVSIVSIQADQSRQFKIAIFTERRERFQSYQFRQINPDPRSSRCGLLITVLVSIVSIQADQSRP